MIIVVLIVAGYFAVKTLRKSLLGLIVLGILAAPMIFIMRDTYLGLKAAEIRNAQPGYHTVPANDPRFFGKPAKH